MGEIDRRHIRHPAHFALSARRLRTTIAGTVDDVYKDYMPPAELSERLALLAGEEAIAQSGIGGKGHFPGPLFLALPPLEIEWHYRIANGGNRPRPTAMPAIPI